MLIFPSYKWIVPIKYDILNPTHYVCDWPEGALHAHIDNVRMGSKRSLYIIFLNLERLLSFTLDIDTYTEIQVARGNVFLIMKFAC